MDERVLSGLFTPPARRGPGNPTPPPTRSPFLGHRRAPPTPWPKGLRFPPSTPPDLSDRLGPGDPGRGTTPRQSRLGLGRRPLPRAPPGRPQLSQGPGPPRAASPPARWAAHRVGLQALARLDGCCQRHRVVQQDLAGRRLLHEGHPGTPVHHRLGTRGRNQRRRLPSPAGIRRRRRCQHAPPHAPSPPAGPSGS